MILTILHNMMMDIYLLLLIPSFVFTSRRAWQLAPEAEAVALAVDVAVTETVPGQWAGRIMAFIDARRGWVTLFEAIAALSVFVDLIVRFDAYPPRGRAWRVSAVGLAMAGLVFKAFAFYLDSAYLE